MDKACQHTRKETRWHGLVTDRFYRCREMITDVCVDCGKPFNERTIPTPKELATKNSELRERSQELERVLRKLLKEAVYVSDKTLREATAALGKRE